MTPELLKKAYYRLSTFSSEVHSPDPLYRSAFGGSYFVDGDPSGNTAFRIQPDGKVTPCVFLSENGGNILHQPIQEILASKIFSRITAREPQGKCKTCSAYFHCKGGDAGASYSEYGHFNGPDPLCWLTEKDTKPLPIKSVSGDPNVHEMYLCTVYLPINQRNKSQSQQLVTSFVPLLMQRAAGY
jgi:radical SAM protein with 4Fe4S-binding SPASM domain